MRGRRWRSAHAAEGSASASASRRPACAGFLEQRRSRTDAGEVSEAAETVAASKSCCPEHGGEAGGARGVRGAAGGRSGPGRFVAAGGGGHARPPSVVMSGAARRRSRRRCGGVGRGRTPGVSRAEAPQEAARSLSGQSERAKGEGSGAAEPDGRKKTKTKQENIKLLKALSRRPPAAACLRRMLCLRGSDSCSGEWKPENLADRGGRVPPPRRRRAARRKTAPEERLPQVAARGGGGSGWDHDQFLRKSVTSAGGHADTPGAPSAVRRSPRAHRAAERRATAAAVGFPGEARTEVHVAVGDRVLRHGHEKLPL